MRQYEPWLAGQTIPQAPCTRCYIIPVVTWLLLASTNCVEIAQLADDDVQTVGSTIIDPLESDGVSDTADPKKSDQDALSAMVSPVFCCNPLEIDFEAVILDPDRVEWILR